MGKTSTLETVVRAKKNRKTPSTMHVLIFCRDPSDWSAETMEEVGPLLLLDDDATSALPNKVSNFCYTFKSKSSIIQNGEAFQQCTLLVAMSHACIIMICFVFLPSLSALDARHSPFPEAALVLHLRCTEKENL